MKEGLVTDNFATQNFRDPASLAYGIVPAFKSLPRQCEGIVALQHKLKDPLKRVF